MKILILFAVLFLSFSVYSQDTISKFGQIDIHGLLTYDFPESYGFNGGVIFPVHFLSNQNQFSQYTHHATHRDVILAIEIGYYRYPSNSSGLLFNTGIGIRKSKGTKRYHEWIVNAGLIRTFYDGKVYEVTSSGSIKERYFFGRLYETIGISYVANWNLGDAKNLFGIQLKPSTWIQYPFNNLIKVHLSIETGITYRLAANKSKRR